MRLKAIVGLVLAVVAVEGAVRAETFVWSGGSGDWSDVTRWRVGGEPATKLPGADDAVEFPTSGITVAIDEADGATAKSVVFDGDNTGTTTLSGGRLTIAGAGISWTNAVPVDCRVPLAFTATGTIQTWGHDAEFHQAVTYSNTTEVVLAPCKVSGTSYTSQTFTYRDVFEAPKATVRSSYSWPRNGNWKFYGKVTAKKIDVASWDTTNVMFYQGGNDLESVGFRYKGSVSAYVENAWSEKTVLTMSSAQTMQNQGEEKFSFNLGNCNQVADRLVAPFGSLGSTSNGKEWNVRSESESGSTRLPVTLTLKGTKDAVCGLAIVDKVSLVWDPVGDYVQTFTNRINKTTRTITVKGGTVRVSGSGSFSNLTQVAIGEKAAFDLATRAPGALCRLDTLRIAKDGVLRIGAEAAEPFAANRCLAQIEEDGKIFVPAGLTVTIPCVYYNGTRVADDTYDSTADWVDGEGSVKVDASVSSVVRWVSPTGGNWCDGANWSSGKAPGQADAEAHVNLDTASDMNVVIDDGDVLPSRVLVANASARTTLKVQGAPAEHANGSVACEAGGTFTVVTNGVYRHVGKGTFEVSAGGAFRVDGGLAAITNTGTFTVVGSLASTGTVAVSSGTLVYSVGSADCAMAICEGGLLELTGGTMIVPEPGNGSRGNPLNLCGGAFRASGSAVYDSSKIIAWVVARFNNGDMTFSGDSLFKMCTKDSTFNFLPETGKSLHVRFEDNACLTNTASNFKIGGKVEAPAVVEFASTANHGSPNRGNNQEGGLGMTGYVGCDAGYGEMVVSAGKAGFGVLGTVIGGSTEKTGSSGVKGVLRVTGGWFRSTGTGYYGWIRTRPGGLNVGYGALTTVTSGRPYEGLVIQTGGVISNEMASTVIGAGYATGTWLQSGGVSRLCHNTSANTHVDIGTAGGVGRFELSGGVAEARGSVYIGGTFQDMYPNNDQDGNGTYRRCFEDNGWPVDRHDADGTLVVSGGTFKMLQADRNCVLGMDGTGTVQVVGSTGTISLQNLILSNTVVSADCTTAARLKFTLDPDGVSPIQVVNKVVNTPGTKVTVDVGAYEGAKRKVRLVEYKTWTGPALEDVEIVGGEGKDILFRTDDKGPYVWFRKGTMLIVR